MANAANRHITSAKRQPSHKDTAIIIPCAGSGTRMKSYGPKALLEVRNTTILERQLGIMRECFPNAEIIVPVGFDDNKMRKALESDRIRMVYNPLHEVTNVSFSIALALYACVSPNVIISYGDLVYTKSVIQCLTGRSKSAIVAAEGMRDEEVGVLSYNGNVIRLAYGIEEKWAQVAFLTGRELRLFRRFAYKDENSKLFGYEILNEIINNGGTLDIVRPKGLACDVDNPRDLDEVAKIPLTI